MGTLYIVATPIGNLKDTTQRASEILKSVDVVVAEDTRITRRLLQHLDASPKLVSLHANSPPERAMKVVEMLKQSDIALVTDAGTPAISDPGASLVRMARAGGHAITPLPGPSAVTAALSVSGYPADRFIFAGFLPRTSGKRKRELQELLEQDKTVVCFEAPHRILKTLADINELADSLELCVCRELTKLHEEVFIGKPMEAIEHFAKPKGEFVLVFNTAKQRL